MNAPSKARDSAAPSGPQWGLRWRRTEPFRRRVALGAMVGSLGGVALAALDAQWLRGSGSETLPSPTEIFLADAGAVVPLTLALGLMVGVVSWVLHQRIDPSPNEFVRQLRAHATGRPADIAAFAPLACLGLFLWMTGVAQLARLLLVTDTTAANVGALIATVSSVLGLVTALTVLALTPWLRQKLAALSSATKAAVDPAVTLGVAALLCGSLFAFGVNQGDQSGHGGFFAIYGVLKRQALDLRMPTMLIVVALLAYLLPSALKRLRPWQAALLALLPLGLTVRAASALEARPDLALAMERHSPVAKRPLRWLQRVTDRDGDGASRWFGGGDCDDTRRDIGPSADDVPDNGIDEDCSGSDLSLAGIEVIAETVAPAAPKTAFPEDGNLVLITVDTLRYDLGYAGYERPISPHIDAWAKKSVIFERAYALASYTGKSVGPMLIGKYGSETHRNWGHFNTFSTEDTFVTERIKRAGFHTIAVHGHRYFGEFGGLERGFDVLDLSAAPPKDAPWAKSDSVTSDRLTDAALAHLKARPKDKRFFLWVHYLDPHDDYLKHEGFPDFGNKARDLYDNEVAFTDHHIGRLLAFLDGDADLKTKTSVIFTSDHGEGFGEKKFWRHGVELWEPLVRVPLVVQTPGVRPHRVKARRSHIDLVPTMLEILNLPRATGEGFDFTSGVSLGPDLLLEPGAEAASRSVMVDMPAGPYNGARRAFIHGDLKLVISRNSKKELFDLNEDPGELRNQWGTRKKEIEAFYALAKKKLRPVKVDKTKK